MSDKPVILGDYRLVKRIARGGMSEVWRAVHTSFDTVVALKLIKDEGLALMAFEREVQTVASLNHPGVIRIFDYGLVSPDVAAQTRHRLPEGAPWFVMELAELDTVHQHPPETYEELYHVVASVLEALAHAHARGFIHRDLKPENLLIARLEDERPLIKLSDFGIARSQFEDRTRAGTESAGTPRYMAPEQFMGKTHLIGPWSDFYALGCVMIEWINGEILFKDVSSPLQLGFKHVNDPLPELRPRYDLPLGFANWLQRMTNKNPQQRFEFAAEALAALPAPAKAVSTRATRLTWDAVSESRPATSRHLFHLQEIPLFGREGERNRLRDQLFTVRRADKPVSVVIRGNAGVGKSRLAEWFAQRAHELGTSTYLRVTHGEMDVRDALTAAVAVHFRCMGKSRDIARARLYEKLNGAVDVEALVDLMHPFLELRDEELVRTLVPERLRDITLLKVIESLSLKRPLILWLDDAQWGANSLRFARMLMELQELRLPVLLLITIRDDALNEDSNLELQHLLQLENVEAMPLAPLTDNEQRDLVRHLVDANDRMIHDVLTRARGIPLHAIHLVGDWLETGAVEPRPEGFVPSRESITTREFIAPRELWKARLEEAIKDSDDPTTARWALEIAAALGRSVSENEWGSAMGMAGIPEQPGLVQRLVGRRLAKWADKSWHFEHGDLIEAIRTQALDEGRWPHAHRACAAALAATEAPRHEMLARIAGHQRAANQLNAAFDTLVTATRAALHAEHGEAATSYRRTLLELGEELSLDPRDMRKGWLALFAIAAGAARRPLAETVRMARVLIDQGQQCGWYEILAHTHEVLMTTLAGLGDPDGAIIAGQTSIDLFEELHEQAFASRVRGAMAQALNEAGLFEEAVSMALVSLEDATALGDLETVARNHGRLGEAYIHIDDFDKARKHFETGLDLAQQLGLRELEAILTTGVATIARHHNRFDDALEGFRRATQILEGIQSRSVWTSRYNQAVILSLQDDWGRSVREFRDGLDAFEAYGLHTHALLARAGVGAEAALRGDDEAADMHWKSVEKGFKASPFYHPDLVWFCRVTAQASDREEIIKRAEKIGRRTRRYRTV